MSAVLRGVGIFLSAGMLLWLMFSSIQPNFAVPRIILGVLLIILSYLMDIKTLLEQRDE